MPAVMSTIGVEDALSQVKAWRVNMLAMTVILLASSQQPRTLRPNGMGECNLMIDVHMYGHASLSSRRGSDQ